MTKQFVFHNLVHSKYSRLVWEEELPDKLCKKHIEEVANLKVGESCSSHDPFIEIERVQDA